MRVNVGIVGYGNLGKATEKIILANKNFNLIAIFSRRIVLSKFNTLVEPYENYKNYVGKIDVMLLCGGSMSDLQNQTPEILTYFDCLNTFDTHKKINSELSKLNKIAQQNNKILIMSCGWDPGLFSIIRALCFLISGEIPHTFWGKGISMGHSDALRQVSGVDDGIQFTLPNKDAIKLAKKGTLPEDMPMHSRECYVVSKKSNHLKLENKIKSLPDYFLNQPTNVKFISEPELLKLKSRQSHKGEIISKFKTISKSNCKINFSVSMESNPDFTATILTSYIWAVINLKRQGKSGAFTPLDISISDLFFNVSHEKIIDLLC